MACRLTIVAAVDSTYVPSERKKLDDESHDEIIAADLRRGKNRARAIYLFVS